MLGARRSLRVATQTGILLKYGRACSCTRFQPASRCILLLSSFPPSLPLPSSPLSSFASSLRPRLFRFPNLPLPVPLSAVTGLSADRSPSNRARQHHQSTSDDFSMAARGRLRFSRFVLAHRLRFRGDRRLSRGETQREDARPTILFSSRAAITAFKREHVPRSSDRRGLCYVTSTDRPVCDNFIELLPSRFFPRIRVDSSFEPWRNQQFSTTITNVTSISLHRCDASAPHSTFDPTRSPSSKRRGFCRSPRFFEQKIHALDNANEHSQLFAAIVRPLTSCGKLRAVATIRRILPSR